MVRLMLVLAPVMCILSGIAVSHLLSKYIKDKDTQTVVDNQGAKVVVIMELEAKKKKLENQLINLRRKCEIHDRVERNLSKIFTSGQISKLRYPANKIEWSVDDISSASCLYSAGPKTYRYLRTKNFPLPGPATLRKWENKIEVEPGILSDVLNLMEKCDLDEKQRLCVPCFNKMKTSEKQDQVRPIYTFLFLLILAVIYKILALLKFDTVELLVLLPRVLQAFLSAFADYRFFVWSGRKKWSIFLLSTAWFWFYTGSRTLSNTVETTLTTIALSYFPWENDKTSFLWITGVCCFIRPTAAITWLPLCVYHMKKSEYRVIEIILKRYLPIGLLVFAGCTAVDSLAHGAFICTPWEFLKYNVLQGVGSFYGVHPWYWYFTAGLPTVLGITIPFLFATIETVRHAESYPNRKWLLGTVFFTLIVLSALPHKEFRFVLIVLPLCLYIVSDFLSRWSRKANKSFLWALAFAIMAGNFAPAAYLSAVHQKGTLEVMPHLARIAREYKDDNNQPANILFLMPCHSTPYFSHIHANITMRFLTCEPNFTGKEGYVDETTEFFKDPAYWMRSHLPSYPKSALPTHVVMFDSLPLKIPEFLIGYDPILNIDHAEVVVDRGGKHVVVYEIHSIKRDKLFESTSDSQKKTLPSNEADDLYNDENF